jgi:glyoxylase-like metal-dependent hydrolase (beta-lactamase superfamily II)
METGEIKVIELTFVNAFLVKVSEGFILIDTGVSMVWDSLERRLLSEGCLPDKLKLVVVTHGDMDHTGGCLKLQEKYHCKIAIHEADLPMVERGVFLKRKVKSFRARFFMVLRRLMRRQLMNRLSGNTFKPDLFLPDGQDLHEYGYDAKIIHIPGHTPGSIGILAEDGSFFAGDIFNNRKRPGTATYIENDAELKASLARLKTLPIRTVYPGHGRAFDFEMIRERL